jgi:putative component of membrane protein insertase Oxa1/YidC/SpoIIIJ protein YidD
MTRRPGLRERFALCAIRGYQRFLSPYKGFSCALRVATGGARAMTD